MTKLKISIIIPVYNSEKYLGHTLESILCQDFSDYEIILVDDGSRDTSGAICDQYAEKYECIKVIHQKNGGICAARNTGLAQAAGEYIAFCDNDDVFLEHLLRDNYQLAEKYDADVVRFSRKYAIYKDGKTIHEETTKFEEGHFSREEFADAFVQIDRAGEGVWAGIYRRSFLQEHQITFDQSMRFGYEDFKFMMDIYECRPGVVLNPKVYYVWTMRYAHSTSGKTDINNIDSLMKCLEKKKKLIKKLGVDKKYPEYWGIEISKRIYTVVRYVSPVKVKMPYKERMQVIRHFREAEVFEKRLSKRQRKALYSKNRTAELIVLLFEKRRFTLLYHLIIGKQFIAGR